MDLLSIITLAIFIVSCKANQNHFQKSGECSSADESLLTGSEVPGSLSERPSVANGHLGTVVNSGIVHVNGIYNGQGSKSHRASIPCANVINVIGGQILSAQMDVYNGIFTETYSMSGANVSVSTYAHRSVNSLLITQLRVSTKEAIIVQLNVTQWSNSSDIKVAAYNSSLPNTIYRNGTILTPETNSSGLTQIHIYSDKVPPQLNVSSAQNEWVFITSVHSIASKALADYKTGVSLLGKGLLRGHHCSSWQSIWNSGRVQIEGNLELQKTTNAAFFYLMSSLPTAEDAQWPFIGVSPCGLVQGGDAYYGHVFWDQDTWMYPGVLLLHQNVARILINTRKSFLGAARQHAKETGYFGARYPWEFGFTGSEVSPGPVEVAQEIHISGDVSFAAMQLWKATHDDALLQYEEFGQLFIDIADFWIDRMQFNATKNKFEIKNVQAPDEYHAGVNNSAFTNAVAQLSLRNAAKVARQAGRSPEFYRYYADHVYIPFDEQLKYHPEYDGYEKGTTIKQADVVLLGFPLMVKMADEVRRNDLEIYSKVVSSDGPAMTWAMHTISWLEFSERDRAHDNFVKMEGNIVEPFKVWTEVTGKQGAPNFLTGIGGFLQSFVFGYGGLRLKDDHLVIAPSLPKNCSSFSLIDVDYIGNHFDIKVSDPVVFIILRSQDVGAAQLRFTSRMTSSLLRLGHPASFALGAKAKLFEANRDNEILNGHSLSAYGNK